MLKGVEADILEDGTVDYTDEERRSFDFVIASVHTRFGQDERTMTERVIRAMDDPTVAILGHPTGRLLLARDPFPLNLERVFRAAAERGVAIEINADPQRLDLDWRHVREAAAMGVIISIGADAHGVNQVSHADVGVALARKGWLTADQVLNARPLSGFLEHVAARRG
jgi:DNA polymerase (family 10)